MCQYAIWLLVMAVLIASQQLQQSSVCARSFDAIAEQHHKAKMLHQKQRIEAQTSAVPTSAPNMWSILQTEKDQNKSAAALLAAAAHQHKHHKHHKHHTKSGGGGADGAAAATANDKSPAAAAAAAGNCPKCHRNEEPAMTEAQLTELRIEYVKNQILKKLKLTERPQVSLGAVPRPVAEGATFQPDQDEADVDAVPAIAEDFYAKTNQKIIFPQLETEHCRDALSVGSSMCFRFAIPADIEKPAIESAHLWVYKQPHISSDNVNFVVNALQSWNGNRIVKPIAIQESNNTEVWVKINITGKMKTWIEADDLSHVIEITCPTCQPHPSLDLLRLDTDYRPFIVINTYNNRTVKRQKRNINCTPGVTSCCRDKLYISFAEIGWNDWILHPPGYDAYFCRGSCASAATITLDGSYYNSVMRKVMYQRNSRGNSLEMVPCCSATKFSSLQLFYTESNNTATQKTLPNMVVEACGCM